MRSKGAWVEKLPTVLWSYHTTSSSSIGETPSSLTYKIGVVLSLDILSESLMVMSFKTNTNDAKTWTCSTRDGKLPNFVKQHQKFSKSENGY